MTILCSNYREMCVTSPIIKLFGDILSNRLEEEYEGIEEAYQEVDLPSNTFFSETLFF